MTSLPPDIADPSGPDMQDALLHGREDAFSVRFAVDVEAAATDVEIGDVRVRYLGKKSPLKLALRRLKELPDGERQAAAERLNALSRRFEHELEVRTRVVHERTLAARLEGEWIDRSLPGLLPLRGMLHPVTEVERRCMAVLRRLGFETADGPEAEEPYYNFDALNIPEHHPARDMQDTFWLEGGRLLRSHTTPIQARVLESSAPLPIRIAAAGRVYRNEAVDATHLAMFHQLEGFWLEEGIDFTHLKGMLAFVARELYGSEQRLRFKPKFYPYTEPSIGLDIACTACDGTGCDACHGAGWVTIMGAGMIHPNIMRDFGYDRPGVRGLAFGWGTTRLASQWIGLSKVRRMYESDQRLYAGLRATETE